MSSKKNKNEQKSIIKLFLILACLSSTSFAANDVNNFGSSISSNPAAVNILTGTGTLQSYMEKKLGIQNNHGIRVGGYLSGDTNYLFSGGITNADKSTSNFLFLLGVSINTQKFIGWEGGLFDIEFLQFNGQNTNGEAGSVQGYNSLSGASPLNRSELYKLWFRQEFFNKKLYIRIGKSVPSMDFNNVSKPIPLDEQQLFIPAVSGLIYTPLFVNTTMLGVMPGYYNSAYGITINFVPLRKWYLSYGVYDGNLAQGIQTGLTGPHFNGSYFHIAETGFNWLSGKNNLPGDFSIGLWHQTGRVQANSSLSENSASGYYIFGTHRLWYRDPFINNSGISCFYQFGKNMSSVLNMTQYVGAGLTAFGLMPNRENDSMGLGAALSWLNQKSFHQNTEVMYQGYYQMQLIKNIYLEPALSYIPSPGMFPHLNAAWAGTLRTMVLF